MRMISPVTHTYFGTLVYALYIKNFTSMHLNTDIYVNTTNLNPKYTLKMKIAIDAIIPNANIRTYQINH